MSTINLLCSCHVLSIPGLQHESKSFISSSVASDKASGKEKTIVLINTRRRKPSVRKPLMVYAEISL